MKFILIVWLTWSSGNWSAEQKGGIAGIEFDSVDACIHAKREVIREAKYAYGICVPKGGKP